MAKPRVTEKLKDDSFTTFLVQTTYPSEHNKPEDGIKFSSIAAYAFIHKDTAASCIREKRRAYQRDMVIWTHREIFRDYTVTQTGQYTGYTTETMMFKNPDDAFRVARFIAEQCELMAGYEHGMPWENGYRGEIETRVVLVSRRETIHVVETM
jgi:hypothetical protein